MNELLLIIVITLVKMVKIVPQQRNDVV